jgi:hypothetical protein
MSRIAKMLYPGSCALCTAMAVQAWWAGRVALLAVYHQTAVLMPSLWNLLQALQNTWHDVACGCDADDAAHKVSF